MKSSLLTVLAVASLSAGCTTISNLSQSLDRSKATDQKPGLERIGKDLLVDAQSGSFTAVAWKSKLRKQVNEGLYQFDRNETAVPVSGQQVEAFITSLEAIARKRAICLKVQLGAPTVLHFAKDASEVDGAISCLRDAPSLAAPSNVALFYVPWDQHFDRSKMIADLENTKKQMADHQNKEEQRKTAVAKAEAEGEKRIVEWMKQGSNYPDIPPAASLATRNHVRGKAFRIYVGAEEHSSDFEVIGNKSGFTFTYANLEQDDDVPHAGLGLYHIRCLVKACAALKEFGHQTFVVKFATTVEAVNGFGQRVVVPVLDVVQVFEMPTSVSH